MLIGFETAQRLHLALAQAGLPVEGVAIGTVADRSTWQARLRPEATSDQIAAAAQLVASVDLDAGPVADARDQAVATGRLDTPEFAAIITVLVDELRVLGSKITVDQFRTAAVTKFVETTRAEASLEGAQHQAGGRT